MFKRLLCKHDWNIVNERMRGTPNNCTAMLRSYLLYCPKCGIKRWRSEEETRTIMNIKKLEKKHEKEA